MIKLVRAIFLGAAVLATNAAVAGVTFFETENYGGRQFTANGTVPNFVDMGYDDVARSAIVDGGPVEVCFDINFGGGCTILQPGSYSTLGSLERSISSVRPAYDARYGAYASPSYPVQSQYPQEYPQQYPQQYPAEAYPSQVYQPQSAYTGTVERIELINKSNPNNIAGLAIGGIIGGLIGREIGDGKALGTLAGAAGGAILGNRIEKQRSRAAHESFRVTVRMDNGTVQTITQDNLADLQQGDRVSVQGDSVVRY